MRAGLAFLLLVSVYALTLASLHPLDLLAGGVIAAALLVALRRFLFSGGPLTPPSVLKRIVSFPGFVFAVAREVARGTWLVTLVVIGRKPLARPGIVAVPVGERTPSGVAATALAVTLSPGEVFVDLDWERQVLLLHVLDATDPEAVRRHHAAFYDRYQRLVFP